ncbi:MAG: tRNA lysidine(34) synthetase TilS [Gammaproteobacteria bacterium]|nr:tRNA lysidine(34) synthetase TilS [Gammaproteobacteria bacterium]
MAENKQVAVEQKIAATSAALAATCVGISRWTVAYSGGWDSTALLVALARTRGPSSPNLRALHVDHGLHAHSQQWADHCHKRCLALGIEFEILKLVSPPPPGESVEAWAREQRYAALARRTTARDLILTAHHRDDQAETFLLNALRGAGPDGLQGIAALRVLGEGWLGRPCLDLSGTELRQYCAGVGVSGVDDPGNQVLNYDRNFLRHHVLPILYKRWPSAASTLSRVASLQRVAAENLAERAGCILSATLYRTSDHLDLAVFAPLSPEWQALCLRQWILSRGHRAPSSAQLDVMLRTVLGSRRDRLPVVEWGRSGLRRHRGCLYLYQVSPKARAFTPITWDLAGALSLPGGYLSASLVAGCGIRVDSLESNEVVVRARVGGERCRPVGSAHSQTLKRLLQTQQIPPWERAQLPLIYVGDTLAAVADLWVCAEYAAGADEQGWKLQWAPSSE